MQVLVQKNAILREHVKKTGRANVIRDGLELIVLFQYASMTAIIMENVNQVNVNAQINGLELIAQKSLVHLIAPIEESVKKEHVTVKINFSENSVK